MPVEHSTIVLEVPRIVGGSVEIILGAGSRPGSACFGQRRCWMYLPFSCPWHVDQSIDEFATVFLSESSRVASTLESPFPIADTPKVGIDEVGTGSGEWVEVAWFSRSSAALGAGVRSAWKSCVSARNWLSSITSLEKKNDVFDAAV